MNESATMPTITIIGTGYVGVTSAAVFAQAGYTVYALEINPKRLASIKSGKSFFYEQYLDPLLHDAVAAGRLIGTDSYEEAIPASDIIFSCVGTPDNPDGSSNLSYVYAAAKETAKYCKPGAVYAQKSTVPVGTGAKVAALFSESNKDTAYVSNPEFLREGTALVDTLWFDRIVVGGDNPSARDAVLALYRQVAATRNTAAEKFSITKPATIPNERYIATTLASAELIKVSANAFLALKISFANSIAKLADAAEADVVEVMDGIGADNRIGRAFLNAGRGYGGGCFPKDVSGLISSGLEHGIDLTIMKAVNVENESMPGYILEKVLAFAPNNSLAGKKVAVLGVSFKAGTSDVRKSPAIKMANLLVEKMGANVHAYDPQALQEEQTREDLHSKVTLHENLQAALEQAEAVVIGTDWPEFLQLTPRDFKQAMAGTLFVDAMNRFDKNAITASGLTYVGVGR